MKHYWLSISFLVLLGFCDFSILSAQQKAPFHQLKSYMYVYQILISELEMMKKDKPTDWEAIEKKVRELQHNLNAMKQFHERAYQSSLDDLSASIGKLVYLEKRRDRQFFNQITKIKQACFQCHSTHQVLGIHGRYDL